MAAAGDPGLAQMAALYRQLGAQPNLGDQVAQGVSPVMPGGTPPSMNDQAAAQIMAASRQAQQEQGGLYQEHLANEAHRQALLAQQAQQMRAAGPNFGMVQPGQQHPSWTQMRPVTGQGFGHDVLNVLGDIGRGAVAGLASTPRGQAVESELYGPQRRALAETAAELRSGESAAKTGAQMYGATSSEQARPFGALAETGRTEQQRAQFEETNKRLTQQMQNQFDVAMSRIATTKDIAGKRMAIQEELGKLMAQVKLRGIAAGLDMNTATNEARTTIANILSNSRFASDHDLLTIGENLLGMAPSAGTANIYPGTPNPPQGQGSRGERGRGPTPGTVEDGYRFKGGNPADPHSWEKVQ